MSMNLRQVMNKARYPSFTLMLEDNPVLAVSFDDMELHIVNKALLPYVLREKLIEPNSSDIKEYYRIMARNMLYLKDYMSSRVLSLSRDNAKQIYTAFNISQDNSIDNRVSICLLCKGINVTDSYWFKIEGSNETWQTVNLRTNHLSEIVDIALEGKQPTFTTNVNCPELTTKGLFKKAWIREDNNLYLLKSDRLINYDNTRAEVLSSKILDCMDVPHVRYELCQYNDLLVAKCKNFVVEGYSFVEAHEIIEYCRDTGSDYVSMMLLDFGKNFANIAVVDYLLQNTDRHDQNYGFIMDNYTGKLVSVAPLFDHNQALIADMLGNDISDTLSQMLPGSYTIMDTANMLRQYSEIVFNSRKWDRLKKDMPEYMNLLEKVEKRISTMDCIKII